LAQMIVHMDTVDRYLLYCILVPAAADWYQ